MAYKIIFIFILFLIPVSIVISPNLEIPIDLEEAECQRAYRKMQLKNIVNFDAFKLAYEGYNLIDVKRKEILTLIDYTKPSTEERLYVIDMKAGRLLFKTHVSHGKGSGENYATSFSNVMNSHQSSLGFYITGSTYEGGNGYSMLLDGLERGINHRAKDRSIVVHGANYSDPSVISSSGRLGRSLGCPALPPAVSRDVIDAIKDGSLMFIYADSKEYIAQSPVLSPVYLAATL